MNALILGIIAAFSVSTTEDPEDDFSWVMDELDNQIEFVSDGVIFEDDQIKIFDMDGTLVNEFDQEDVIQNELDLEEIDEVRESDFLFEYQGNGYYLK